MYCNFLSLLREEKLYLSVLKYISIMTRCSIMSCSSRKDKDHPELTLHRLPRNNLARQKWLDIIGPDNLNFNSKCIYICSIHFEESCINRTLDVVRLQDNSVPSLHLQPHGTHAPMSQPSISKNEELKNQSISSTLDDLDPWQSQKIKKLNKRCADQRKKITRISETIRRREKKIAELDNTKRDLIKEIKKRKLIVSEKSLFLEEFVSSMDLVQRKKSSANSFYHIKSLINDSGTL